MCGIFGFLNTKDSIQIELLKKMSLSLRHRGPDDEGILLANLYTNKILPCSGIDSASGNQLRRIDSDLNNKYNLAFGHRRLSILDLSIAGHQPMSDDSKQIWITYNGEIYNYIELREQLRAIGYVFHTGTDTEVILNAYKEWGEHMLPKLIGMFSLAILDLQRNFIFCARDFFGIKPFYYCFDRHKFAFASEPKALLELPWLPRAVDASRLYEFLRYGYSDYGSDTLFSHIKQLESAHFLKLSYNANDKFAIEVVPYWQLNIKDRQKMSFEESVSHLRDLFIKNITMHLRSDVPVGVCLSGGIDSSSIIMVMRQILGQKEPIHAFSYIAEDSSYINEEVWCDIVAKESNIIHHKIKPTANNLISDINDFIREQDEPMATTSVFAQRSLFRCAHDAGIKVMLDGQGADEIMGGYHSLVAARLSAMLHQLDWLQAFRFFYLGTSAMVNYRSRLLLTAAGRLLPHFFQNILRNTLGEGALPNWLNAKWFASKGVLLELRYPRVGENMFREEALDFIRHHSLPQLLRWEDRNSMSASVESRVPFLTPEFAQFTLSLPDDYLIDSVGCTKAVFRKSMRGIVPDKILDRKDKVGFATPENKWMKELNPIIEGAMSQYVKSESYPFLNLSVCMTELKNQIAGNKRYNSMPWRVLNTMLWLKNYNLNT